MEDNDLNEMTFERWETWPSYCSHMQEKPQEISIGRISYKTLCQRYQKCTRLPEEAHKARVMLPTQCFPRLLQRHLPPFLLSLLLECPLLLILNPNDRQFTLSYDHWSLERMIISSHSHSVRRPCTQGCFTIHDQRLLLTRTFFGVNSPARSFS